MFGNTSRNMICGARSPRATAASMYPLVAISSVAARTIRATPGERTRTTPRMMTQVPLPAPAINTSRSTNGGNTIRTSTERIRIGSSRESESPAKRPIRPPITYIPTTQASDVQSTGRPPSSTRLSTSRPRVSVPSGARDARPGGGDPDRLTERVGGEQGPEQRDEDDEGDEDGAEDRLAGPALAAAAGAGARSSQGQRVGAHERLVLSFGTRRTTKRSARMLISDVDRRQDEGDRLDLGRVPGRDGVDQERPIPG